MTSRPDFIGRWASLGAAETTDPDLDPAHPSGRGAAGKYNLGWVSTPIKQPHGWRNFVDNRVDEALLEIAEVGSFEYRVDVSYRKGVRVIGSTGVQYTSLVENNMGNALTGASWEPVVEDFPLVTAAISSSIVKVDAHVPRMDNPHSVTYTQLLGYSKSEIDVLVKGDLQDLLAHTQSIGNPHVVTAAQLLAVPATGGDFTGVVDYHSMALRGYTMSAGTHVGGGAVGFYDSNNGFGIRYSSEPVTVANGTTELLLHGGNYLEMNSRHSPDYALPAPLLDIRFVDGLNSMAVGAYMLTYTDSANADVPVVSSTGLVLNGTNTISIDKQFANVTVMTIHSGVKAVYDLAITGSNLKVQSTGTYERVTFYPQLTTKQKAMLQ